MPTDLTEIIEPNLVLVEGKDEVNSFSAFLKYYSYSNIQLIPYDGINNLNIKLKSLKDLPNAGIISSLGIVRDADDRPADTFKSVCEGLNRYGYDVPNNNLERTTGLLKVITYIIPSISSPGMLEDLFLKAIENEPVNKCIEQYIECLDSIGLKPKPNRVSKAKINTYISSQEKPYVSLGVAAREGYFQLQSSSFDDLRLFLDKLIA